LTNEKKFQLLFVIAYILYITFSDYKMLKYSHIFDSSIKVGKIVKCISNTEINFTIILLKCILLFVIFNIESIRHNDTISSKCHNLESGLYNN